MNAEGKTVHRSAFRLHRFLFIPHPCLSVIGVPFLRDELDGDHFAVRLPGGILRRTVGQKNRGGLWARAARHLPPDICRVGDKSDVIERVVTKAKRARIAFDNQHDAFVLALYADEQAAHLLAGKPQLLQLRPRLRRVAWLKNAGRGFFSGSLLGNLLVQGFDAGEIFLAGCNRREKLLRLRAYQGAGATEDEWIKNAARNVELLASQVDLGQQQHVFLSAWRKPDGLLEQRD